MWDEVTWFGVAVATLFSYALGALWFTPLFGAAWDRSIGHERKTTDGRFPTAYYIVPLVGSALTAVVIAVLVALADSDGIVTAVGVGIAVGVAIAAASTTNALTPHTPHPYQFAAITGGYHLAACAGAGLVIGLF